MLTLPVPLALIYKSSLVLVFSIKLSLISKSPTRTLLPTTTLSVVAILNSCAFVEIVFVLPLIVTLPILNTGFVISKSVTRAIPSTSRGYCGLVVLTPIRRLLTSRYRRSVSNAKSTPSRSRFDFKSGPEIRPIAISSPQHGDLVPPTKFSSLRLFAG